MPSKSASAIERARSEGRPALICYLPAGYPDVQTTIDAAVAMAENGADIIEVGIPSGGLFTGAEGIKTEEQAENWGGEAGVAYDPCYHAKCDNLGNINRKALNVNSDAMAWVIGKYALSTKSVNGVKPNAAKSKAAIAKQRANTARSLPMVANENAHDHAAVK